MKESGSEEELKCYTDEEEDVFQVFQYPPSCSGGGMLRFGFILLPLPTRHA